MIDRINVQLIINGIPLIIVSLSEMSLFAEPKECLKVSYMIFAYYKINHDEFINADVVNKFIHLVNLSNIKEPDTFKNVYKSAQELFGLFKLKTLMGLKSKYEDRDCKSPYL